MIMQLEEWWEKSITRGTSGDMVMDILSDWEQERNGLLTRIKRLVEGIEGILNQKDLISFTIQKQLEELIKEKP